MSEAFLKVRGEQKGYRIQFTPEITETILKGDKFVEVKRIKKDKSEVAMMVHVDDIIHIELADTANE